MKIGIDIRCLMENKKTGVEEFTTDFLKNILQNDPKNQFLLFANSYKKIKGDFEWLKKFPNVQIKNYGFPNKILNFLLWFFKWPKIDILLGGVDVFFAPNISFLAVSSKCHLALTIHDLSFERFPQHFSPKRKLWHFILNPRKTAKRADKILTVSHSTKNDLIGLYGIDPKKIEVIIPIGKIDRFFAPTTNAKWRKIKARYNLPNKYILYLGTIEPRKNIISLIKTYDQLKKSGSSFKSMNLVIAGRLGWSYGKILKAIQKSTSRNQIHLTDFVEDQDKSALYQNASVFVYPSFFEGFGFPPAEAMASGTPVITSNCSSLPEVTKNAAIMIDPYKPNEIFLALQEILKDNNLSQKYQKMGLQRAKEISDTTKKQKFNSKLFF